MRIGGKEVRISLTTNMLECTSSPGRGRFLLAEGIRETDPKFEIPGRSRASNRNPALGEHGEGDADFGLVIPKFQPYQPLLPQGNLNTGAKNKNCILFTRNGPDSDSWKIPSLYLPGGEKVPDLPPQNLPSWNYRLVQRPPEQNLRQD